MITVIKNAVDKDDLASCIEDVYNYLLNEYKKLDKREDYLNADVANRQKFEQPYVDAENELEEVKTKTNQLSELIDVFKDAIKENDIEIEEES